MKQATIAAVVFSVISLSGFAQTLPVTTQTAAQLTGDGPDAPMLPVVTDAVEPEAGLTPALGVMGPNSHAPHVFNDFIPHAKIPYSGTVRQVKAFWNGTALNLIEPSSADGVTDDAHGYGSNISFFEPLFSLGGLPPGSGTLEVKGYDANDTLIQSVSVPNLILASAPAPVSASTIGAIAHPRIYLTAARMLVMQQRSTNDIARQRYEDTLQTFLDALATTPEGVLSDQFEAKIYGSEDYIPLLGLAYQLNKTSDPNKGGNLRQRRACARHAHRR